MTSPFITLPGVSGALYVDPCKIDVVQTKTPTDSVVVCGGQLFHVKLAAEQVVQAVIDYSEADTPELETRYVPADDVGV